MAQKEEREPLLAGEEQQEEPLKQDLDAAYPPVPPPPYEPPEKKSPEGPGYTAGPAVHVLPTYEQSEKFEREGVLEVNDHTPDGSVSIVLSQSEERSGSIWEFWIFFTICVLFSWIGYIVSCCLASSVAAQAGAAAGLGLSLVIKTILVEFQPVYLQSAVASVMCPDDYYLYYYYDEDNWTQCTTQYYSVIRLLFWVMGFLGLFLFARGLAVFCQTRQPRPPRPPQRNENTVVP